MGKFRDFIKDTFVPTKRAIHDCVDTGADLTLTDGVEIDYPCDCVGRDYKSTGIALWDNSTGLIKDEIDDSVILSEFNLTVNGAINTEVHIRFYIPNTILGDIPVKTLVQRVSRNNIDEPIQFATIIYDATDSDAKTYGFKVKLSANGANLTLKARSVLVTT
jgi:hypothetical protein